MIFFLLSLVIGCLFYGGLAFFVSTTLAVAWLVFGFVFTSLINKDNSMGAGGQILFSIIAPVLLIIFLVGIIKTAIRINETRNALFRKAPKDP